MSKPSFKTGDLVEHARFKYRGVVVSVDPVFSGTDSWYKKVAKSRPPKNKPWYHILVDESNSTTYVAERHLRQSANDQQVDHPMLGNFFNTFTGSRYLQRSERI